MNILIINGPNLGALGRREPETYGTVPFDTFLYGLQNTYPQHKIVCFQSDIEGELVRRLQKADEVCDAVVLNAGAYTHTSIALADAVRSLSIPVIEVHISNIFAREPFRHRSYLTPVCSGLVSGFGLEGYRMAVEHLIYKP